jgi:hypothetical protein
MADETTDEVIPIDPDVRSVLDEFSRDPVAMASEIVQLRAELAQARLDADPPRSDIILQQPQRPPDSPSPIRFSEE